MGFTINETITTELHYKDISLIAVAMGEYQRRYKETADKEVLQRMARLVDRLGYEMYNHPRNHIDLKKLYSLMRVKKYHYSECKTNDKETDLYISFSTVHNGRGNCVEIRIGDVDNDIDYMDNKLRNINSDELISFINQHV